MTYRILIVIPTYNHSDKLTRLFSDLSIYKLPCLLVDDGSNKETKLVIDQLKAQFDFIDTMTLEQNFGKGYAVTKGFQYAFDHHYTHVLQVDADYQHDISDIKKFLLELEKNPNALISGKPIYDKDAPKSRVYGRKITNFWVAIETLSLAIPESMCGFRVYPLASTMTLIKQTKLSKRMTFDIEILVRLYWLGVKIIFIPTKVNYPSDGSSNFKVIKDNFEISLIHSRLFFGMFYRLPNLLLRKFKINE